MTNDMQYNQRYDNYNLIILNYHLSFFQMALYVVCILITQKVSMQHKSYMPYTKIRISFHKSH